MADALPGLGFLRDWTVFQRDLLMTALLGITVAEIVVLGGDEVLFSTNRNGLPLWVGGLALGATIAPLPWRRLRPELVMTLSGMATGLFYFLGFISPVGTVGVLFALYATAAYSPTRWDGFWSLVVSLVFVTISFALIVDGLSAGVLAEYALSVLLFVTSWGLGEATRSRRALEQELYERALRAEAAQQLEHDRATAEERNRIARELHDVVAHTVSVLVVQAGAGRHVAGRQPERAAEVLGQIEHTGREALDELRRVLGVLRRDAPGEEVATTDRTPQPTLATLPELVAPLREAGMPVDLDVRDGRADGQGLPGGVELSAYRIVQEALTNVLKHAGRVDEVRVEVEVDDERLVLAVRDDGRGAPMTDAWPRGGQGLVGMRERVDMLGGRIEAGPRRGGGFLVRAVIPLPSAAGASVLFDPQVPPTAVGSEGLAT